MKKKGTKEKILSIAMSLLQKHGYHGFSFQHIADQLGIKKPSLYDHYSSKDALIIAILENYSVLFDQWANGLTHLSPLERIRKVFFVFHSFVSDRNKICPVLALAADFQTLDSKIKKSMTTFVDHWIVWLSNQITQGQLSGEIRNDFSANQLAQFVYSLGMGSQFQARIKSSHELPLQTGDQVIVFLKR